MNDDYKGLSDAMAAAVENIGPSVVAVDARRRLPATGIVWDAEGVIVTAHHVVERDEEISIGLHDGSIVAAKLVGLDPQNDIAVLQADGHFTPANWAKEEDIKVGHLVLAVGRPFGDLQTSLGVVSAASGRQNFGSTGKRKRGNRQGCGERGQAGRGHGRGEGRSQGRGDRERGRGRGFHHEGRLHRAGRHFRGPKQGRGWRQMLAGGHIRSDVVMYPGFSGGPLLSAYGNLYGMNTSGFMHRSGLAVPVNSVERSVKALLAHGRVRQGYLGVRTHTAELPEAVADELGQRSAALVISVIDNSPAQEAGLLVGDIIVEINGESIIDAEGLPLTLTGDLIGTEVPINIVRGGQLQEISVTIGEHS